jgi:hypothetical protein
LANGGVVPASGPLSTCPDIWISGTQRVPDFQTTLATSSSYATASGNTIQQQQTTFIYVRGMNGGSQPLSTQVQLFGVPSSLIQWPSQWGNFQIRLDIEYPPTPVYVSSISNLAPGAVGVAQNTFVWYPEPPPPGTNHYCLIAWMNNPSNPFPNTLYQIDIAALVAHNLGYGWLSTGFGARKTSLQSADSPTASMVTRLHLPENMPAGSREYYLVLIPSGFPAGWQVSLSCSQSDAKGNEISIPRQRLPTRHGQFIGVYARLEPGFDAALTFNCYQNGAAPPANACLQVQAYYVTQADELARARDLGVVDLAMSRALQSAFRGFGLSPAAVILLGEDNLTITGGI